MHRKESQKLGSAWARAPCDRGVADTLELHSSAYVLYSGIWSLSVKTVRALLRRSAWKKIEPRVTPFNVTQGHRNRHVLIRRLW